MRISQHPRQQVACAEQEYFARGRGTGRVTTVERQQSLPKLVLSKPPIELQTANSFDLIKS